MANINSLKASDGTGNAAVATIQNVRAPLATTLIVDTVENINSEFHGTMGTPHTFVDPVTSEEITVISEATAVDFKGHVDGGNLEIDTIASGYTDNGSQVNDIVIIKPTSQWANEVADILEVSLSNNGELKAIVDNPGWTEGLPAVTTIVANGNRSYTLTHASSVASTISEGMRRRFTRTTAGPTTAFSLDGTNDYYVKTSPAGMTFTDDFVVSAWVRLTSYNGTIQMIASRYNGTSGWYFYVTSSGQIALAGVNAGAANISQVISYQSIPLNKWVHVAAQLDMSTFTATTTTSYVMIDGLGVPASVSRGGTNPTTLVQAGNLEIGSDNGGLLPFGGNIAQVAIYNAKVTQATITASMNQALTGSETSLISAYSNGSVTDLNTTNANNLTATNGATTVASSWHGNRGVSSTLEYGLTMSVSSDGLTEVVQVPEGCALPTTGGITASAYSSMANPYGWVSDKGRWGIGTYINASSNVTLTSNATWYNLNHSITVPIGKWLLGFQLGVNFSHSGASYLGGPVTLSTGNNTESDKRFTYYGTAGSNVSTTSTTGQGNKVNDVALAAQTPYYLNTKPTNNNTTATVDVTGSSILFATPAGL